ncbi:hypothetical protein HK105_205754 [Polyrhizophydium stewartii]|uniref:Polysaccharide lyase 14 domain-containing protein n=1 Tax=Polyrhizophydium stewartii TaxID=2732419 RepID=A0ABR4N503_9FUNG
MFVAGASLDRLRSPPGKDLNAINEILFQPRLPATKASWPDPPPPVPSRHANHGIWFSQDNISPNHPASTFKINLNAYGLNIGNFAIVKDPAGGGGYVWRAFYPKGSYRPKATDAPVGGVGLYASPIDLSHANTVKFEYDIYFPVGFEFVKGGKLPGLYGGREECTGGAIALDCFSARFMFRELGAGEIYIYVDKYSQDPQLCDMSSPLVPGTVCDGTYGYSLGRGSWKFPTGRWMHISQTLTLNSFAPDGSPLMDGSAIVKADGVTVVSADRIVWRTFDVRFKGIDFETFFGGSTNDWATPKDQYSYYRKMVLTIIE